MSTKSQLLNFLLMCTVSVSHAGPFTDNGPCEWRALLSTEDLKNGTLVSNLELWRNFAVDASALPLAPSTAENLQVAELSKAMSTRLRVQEVVRHHRPGRAFSYAPMAFLADGKTTTSRHDEALVGIPLVQTAAGHLRLAQLLGSPPSSHAEIQGRQNIVRYLSEDPQGVVLLAQITEILLKVHRFGHKELFCPPDTNAFAAGMGSVAQGVALTTACLTGSPSLLGLGFMWGGMITPNPQALNEDLFARGTHLKAIQALRNLAVPADAPHFMRVIWSFLEIAEKGLAQPSRSALLKSIKVDSGLDQMLNQFVAPASLMIQLRGRAVAKDSTGWLRLTSALADIDVFAGLARFAIANRAPESSFDIHSQQIVADAKNPFKGGVIFPELLDPREHPPTLEIEDGHNPLFYLDPEKRSAANSIRLNRAHGTSVLAVMGPQEKGKTTTLRMASGLTLLALIGSAVPATSMRLTPFHIQSAMNIKDDPEAGLSLFAAKSQRLAQIMAMAKNSSTPQLIIGDEIFNGTSHEEQDAGELGAIRWVSSLSNTVALFSTNNRSIVSALSEIPGVEIVHMGEKEGETPYRIHAGPSTVRNAHVTLQRFGFPDAIVEDVRRAGEEAERAERDASGG